MNARYFDLAKTALLVSLVDGDTLGNMRGPVDFTLANPSPGNAEYDALSRLVEKGNTAIAAYAPPIAPFPNEISDRQFAQVLALDGVISKTEALAWAARGDLPQKLKEALVNIPETGGERFAAEMMLSGATTYKRDHPLTPKLGALLGYDAAALDDLWRRGAIL